MSNQQKDLRPDFVYLMKAGEFYKIGVSKTPKKRVTRMQTGCPRKIKIIYEFEVQDAYKMEFELHRLYQSKRTHGEWFIDIDEDEFLRAVESYDWFVDYNLPEYDNFAKYFRDHDDASLNIYFELVHCGELTASNISNLKKENAIHAINSAVRVLIEEAKKEAQNVSL